MASTSKRMRVEEERSEEESTTVYDGDSDPEGMTSGCLLYTSPSPRDA